MTGLSDHRVTFSVIDCSLEARCECGWFHRWKPAPEFSEGSYGMIFAMGMAHSREMKKGAV